METRESTTRKAGDLLIIRVTVTESAEKSGWSPFRSEGFAIPESILAEQAEGNRLGEEPIADPHQENGKEGEEERQLQSEQLADRVSMGGHGHTDRLFSSRQQNH